MVNAVCSLKSPDKVCVLQAIVSASRDNSKEARLQPCLYHAKTYVYGILQEACSPGILHLQPT